MRIINLISSKSVQIDADVKSKEEMLDYAANLM